MSECKCTSRELLINMGCTCGHMDKKELPLTYGTEFDMQLIFGRAFCTTKAVFYRTARY